MLGIKHTDRTPNDEVYQLTQQIPLSVKIVKRQLTWIGHILRREKEEPIRTYSLYEHKHELGKTRKGRPT